MELSRGKRRAQEGVVMTASSAAESTAPSLGVEAYMDLLNYAPAKYQALI